MQEFEPQQQPLLCYSRFVRPYSAYFFGGGGVRGVPETLISLKSSYLCNLSAAKGSARTPLEPILNPWFSNNGKAHPYSVVKMIRAITYQWLPINENHTSHQSRTKSCEKS